MTKESIELQVMQIIDECNSLLTYLFIEYIKNVGSGILLMQIRNAVNTTFDEWQKLINKTIDDDSLERLQILKASLQVYKNNFPS